MQYYFISHFHNQKYTKIIWNNIKYSKLQKFLDFIDLDQLHNWRAQNNFIAVVVIVIAPGVVVVLIPTILTRCSDCGFVQSGCQLLRWLVECVVRWWQGVPLVEVEVVSEEGQRSKEVLL